MSIKVTLNNLVKFPFRCFFPAVDLPQREKRALFGVILDKSGCVLFSLSGIGVQVQIFPSKKRFN